VVKESELKVILYKLDSKKIKGGGSGLNPNLDVCMTASLTCPRHKYACVMSSSSRLDRRADLAGRPSCDVHPTISMTEWCMNARAQGRENLVFISCTTFFIQLQGHMLSFLLNLIHTKPTLI
jgi:hypothetical protein